MTSKVYRHARGATYYGPCAELPCPGWMEEPGGRCAFHASLHRRYPEMDLRQQVWVAPAASQVPPATAPAPVVFQGPCCELPCPEVVVGVHGWCLTHEKLYFEQLARPRRRGPRPSTPTVRLAVRVEGEGRATPRVESPYEGPCRKVPCNRPCSSESGLCGPHRRGRRPGAEARVPVGKRPRYFGPCCHLGCGRTPLGEDGLCSRHRGSRKSAEALKGKGRRLQANKEWARKKNLVRNAWESDHSTLSDISKAFGVPMAQIRQWATEECWVKQTLSSGAYPTAMPTRLAPRREAYIRDSGRDE